MSVPSLPGECVCGCHYGLALLHFAPCCQGACNTCHRFFEVDRAEHEKVCAAGLASRLQTAKDTLEPWWPDAVKAIYMSAFKKIGGDHDKLHHGPAHTVWDDCNFDDASIDACLQTCRADKKFWMRAHKINAAQLEITWKSLVALREIPEAERGTDPNG